MILAECLGIDPACRRDLGIAALLIDLGKVGVRPSALSKGGQLSEVERESLRQSLRRHEPLRRMTTFIDPH